MELSPLMDGDAGVAGVKGAGQGMQIHTPGNILCGYKIYS